MFKYQLISFIKHFKCLNNAEYKAKTQSLGSKNNLICSLSINLLDYSCVAWFFS